VLNPMSLNPGKVSLAYRGVFVFQVLDFGTVKSDVPASALTATAVPARGVPMQSPGKRTRKRPSNVGSEKEPVAHVM